MATEVSAPSVAPAQVRFVPCEEGAEAFVEIVNANGVDCLFLMPGTDTFPIQEALAKFKAQGRRIPRVVSCPHETTVMSAAHGYFNMTRRAQVGLVHVDVGTQMVGGMLHNAQRGQAGVVLCAGRTPLTMDGELRGGRDIAVHWIQDRRDQPGIVRDYTKWNYDVVRIEGMNHIVQRAFQVANSEPCAPVYLTLGREALMERIDGIRLLPPSRYAPPVPSAADPRAVEEIARVLIAAERPLILASHSGRTRAGFEALARAAHVVAVPVIERREHLNLPMNHPMHLGVDNSEAFTSADVILVVDSDVPYIPAQARPREDARLIQIDVDPVKASFPIWGYPIDLAVQADSAKALEQLADAAESLLTASDRDRLAERRERITAAHHEQRASFRRLAEEAAARRPISRDYLSYCLNQIVDDDTVVVDDSVTSSYIASRHIEVNAFAGYFKSGGSSMGWGLGASLGTKLAAPDRTVISIDADGNFMDSSPESPLWASAAYGAPFLSVIFNNSRYNAVKAGLLRGYSDSYSARTDTWLGIDLPRLPAFEQIAQACGAYGERVEDPADVQPALERGLARVRDGQTAVLNVIVE